MGAIFKNKVNYTGGNGIGLVQSGHFTFTLTGSQLEQSVPVTFPVPFKEVPNITVSLSDPSRGQQYDPQTGLGVMSPSTTGFNLMIKSSNFAVAGNITIYWIASTRIAGDIDADYHRYSTEEHIVGEWIDGKTLYEKTIDLGQNIDISYNSWTEINADSTGIDLIIDVKGTNAGGTNYDIMLGKKTANNKFEAQTSRNNYTASLRYLTIQYTKS